MLRIRRRCRRRKVGSRPPHRQRSRTNRGRRRYHGSTTGTIANRRCALSLTSDATLTVVPTTEYDTRAAPAAAEDLIGYRAEQRPTVCSPSRLDRDRPAAGISVGRPPRPRVMSQWSDTTTSTSRAPPRSPDNRPGPQRQYGSTGRAASHGGDRGSRCRNTQQCSPGHRSRVRWSVSTADEGAANRGDGANRPVGEFDGGGDAARYEVGDAVALGARDRSRIRSGRAWSPRRRWPSRVRVPVLGRAGRCRSPLHARLRGQAQSKGARHAFGSSLSAGAASADPPGMAEPCADSRPDS
jgi:hypothetical protein